MTLYIQKKASELTTEQLILKESMDLSYEAEVQKLSATYYEKKRTVGVTQEESATYTSAKSSLWNSYVHAALQEGLMVEISTEDRLMEASVRLNEQLSKVNKLRTDLKLKELSLTEVAVAAKL